MFSGVVKIADIDDYITPSQNCIKTILPKNDQNTGQKSSKLKLTIEEGSIDQEVNFFSSRPDLIKIKDKERQTAKVSLNDCLACNGCVTTAETLLIQQQSLEEFLRNCENKDKITVVCISNQSIISIAHFYSISEEDALIRLASLLETFNVQFLFNLNIANKLSLVESYEEFKNKVLKQGKESNYILSSECPGWICYAEKIIGQWIIPFCSQVKSGQQIMGNLIKNILSKSLQRSIEDIYNVCLMPCFDKKLEASRENYKRTEIKEVDTVVTSSEIIELLEQHKFGELKRKDQKIIYNFNSFMKYMVNMKENFLDLKKMRENYNLIKEDIKLFFEVNENFSSNGYSEFMLSNYLKETFSSELSDKIKIERKIIKNSDFKEINVFYENKEIISFGIVYGLKNIKILTKNLEKKKSKYSYIEIMACPGGCLNGGGQLKSNDISIKPRDLIKIFESKINKLNQENGYLRKELNDETIILKELIETKYQEIKWKEVFAASYKEIDKSLLSGLNLKW